ncbi:MAG: hypothetical protein CMB94_03200 [Flammeovirgaceae bacterium]|nr:hypothetical protein [Flammeovirgaceae bacterium]
MKIKYLILLLFLSSYESFTQSTEFDIQKSIYEKAKSYNDPNVAITALYNMVALQPDNLLLKDSLMREYLSLSQWAPTYMISREIMALQPNNNFALEVSCVALQNLGLKQEALNEYESLYLRTDRVDVLYTISFLQFELKNLNESLTNLNILLENEQTEEMMVSVNKNQNERQEVSMRAQLNYLKGLVFLEQGKNDLAKESFNSAIELSPEFNNAIEKLNSL